MPVDHEPWTPSEALWSNTQIDLTICMVKVPDNIANMVRRESVRMILEYIKTIEADFQCGVALTCGQSITIPVTDIINQPLKG